MSTSTKISGMTERNGKKMFRIPLHVLFIKISSSQAPRLEKDMKARPATFVHITYEQENADGFFTQYLSPGNSDTTRGPKKAMKILAAAMPGPD